MDLRMGQTVVRALGCLLVVSLIPTRDAEGALMEADLLTPGDALITLDNQSGLQWLDADVAKLFTVSEVLGDAGGWLSLGFRYATASEVCGLFAAHAIAPTPCPGAAPAGTTSATGAVVAALQALLGLTQSLPDRAATIGSFDDGDMLDGSLGAAAVTYRFAPDDLSIATVRANDFELLDDNPEVGHFLVRSVPEPGWLAHLAIGAVLLLIARRTKPAQPSRFRALTKGRTAT